MAVLRLGEITDLGRESMNEKQRPITLLEDQGCPSLGWATIW